MYWNNIKLYSWCIYIYIFLSCSRNIDSSCYTQHNVDFSKHMIKSFCQCAIRLILDVYLLYTFLMYLNCIVFLHFDANFYSAHPKLANINICCKSWCFIKSYFIVSTKFLQIASRYSFIQYLSKCLLVLPFWRPFILFITDTYTMNSTLIKTIIKTIFKNISLLWNLH